MTESKEIIRVEKLNKYFGELHVLKDIDLTVYENDVVVLIGASGSGKSTLLRCMNFLEIKMTVRSLLMAVPFIQNEIN